MHLRPAYPRESVSVALVFVELKVKLFFFTQLYLMSMVSIHPPQSLDLDPVEPLWHVQPRNQQQLCDAIMSMWT